jgi:phospholipid/cholesterol/gamma-HCH transport system substrate-binding protein
MITRSQKLRLGVFISVALIVVILGVMSLSYNIIFATHDIYYIAYEDVSVSGIDIGSQVKYLGITVGSVRRIEIDPKNINRVIITVGIEPGTPIKEDVRAEIATIGITGLKLIELRGGTIESMMLKPGGFIQAGKSITDDITGRAEIITEKIELVLNNLLTITSPENQEKIVSFIDESAATAAQLNYMLTTNSDRIERTLSNLDTLSHDLRTMVAATHNMVTSIETTIGSDTLKQTLYEIHQITQTFNQADIYRLIDELNHMIQSTNTILSQTQTIVARNRSKLIDTIDELHHTSQYLHSTARMIDANPSILLRGIRPDNPPDNKLE